MKLKKYISILLCAFVFSCNNYLTLEPLNEVVLENFWQEKSDVESVVASCYYNLCSDNVLLRAFVWGELRSDNIVYGMSIGESESDILEANILPENKYADWSSFYNVINLCNTVLYYAPEVQKKDQSLTDSNLKAYLAEMLTLRSLCYFYLIRTFYEIPLVLDATIGDDVDLEVPASSADVVLDQLVVDLLKAEEYARTIYSKEYYNKGRISKIAVQALLADVYLWKGDYDKCIQYCQKVIDAKTQEALNMFYTGSIETIKEIPLIISSDLAIETYAYSLIFGVGNSFESLFELQFLETEGPKNPVPSTFFGTSGDMFGPISANPKLGTYIESGGVFKKTDNRRKEFVRELSQGIYPICKYASTGYYTNAMGTTYNYRSKNDANWIIYRLTDVVLMQAEAMALKTNSTDEDLRAAFNLVMSVNLRSNPGAGSDTLIYSDYNTPQKMEELVFAERQRELMFEGKRWFDLVRMCRRDGNNSRMLDLVIPKYSENQTAIKSKMTSPLSLYFPISAEELKVNRKIRQNPFYDHSGTIERN